MLTQGVWYEPSLVCGRKSLYHVLSFKDRINTAINKNKNYAMKIGTPGSTIYLTYVDINSLFLLEFALCLQSLYSLKPSINITSVHLKRKENIFFTFSTTFVISCAADKALIIQTK